MTCQYCCILPLNEFIAKFSFTTCTHMFCYSDSIYFIYSGFLRRLLQWQCLYQFTWSFSKGVSLKTIVQHWINKFKHGRCSLTDEFKEGRSKSVIVSDNIADVGKIIVPNFKWIFICKKDMYALDFVKPNNIV